jgi:hypothetical protein
VEGIQSKILHNTQDIGVCEEMICSDPGHIEWATEILFGSIWSDSLALMFIHCRHKRQCDYLKGLFRNYWAAEVEMLMSNRPRDSDYNWRH